jgi:hypothetical protein
MAFTSPFERRPQANHGSNRTLTGTNPLRHDEANVAGRADCEQAWDARHRPARPQVVPPVDAPLALEFCVMLPQTGASRGIGRE